MLAPILFLGPLFTDVALEKIKLQDAWEGLTSFVGVRNYLVVRRFFFSGGELDVN